MDDLAEVERLTQAITQAARSAQFCVAGQLGIADPGLEVEGLGRIKLPLKAASAKTLVAVCRPAAYGKGTKTLVNKEVRDTWELDPTKFHLSNEWNFAIAEAAEQIALELGLPENQLEARLYKLLVYTRGGFFLPHRDSEKHDRMVASLVVVLPNRFEGGALIVRHGAAKQRLKFDEAAAGQASSYAAFYADCEHEVERVTKGERLCLSYNLVLRKPQRGKPTADPGPAAPVDALAESIGSWIATRPAEPLVFALEHHYTPLGLSLDLLKGADRQLADLVTAAAGKANCLVHLSQVSRHLLQFADNGSLDRAFRRHYHPVKRALEIGETYEDDLSGADWVDVDGKKQPWGTIPFELTSIVASTPIDEWKPTSEQFEGYTGNEGNTLDRWYHRSALVVWHRDQHFEVVASSGAEASIPLFCSLMSKLAKTPKKRQDQARGDCVQLARAIIARWPRRVPKSAFESRFAKEVPYEECAEQLLSLGDQETIAQFLAQLAARDTALPLKSLIVAACRTFGWNAFAAELKSLISTIHTSRGREDIALRDMQWLADYCCVKSGDADHAVLAQELCRLAVQRFCEPHPPQVRHYPRYGSKDPSVAESSLPWLLKAVAAGGCDQELERVIRFVQESPEVFRLDQCQVPCLTTLIPWSEKQLGQMPSSLAAWLASVRQQLEAATAKPPAPPQDWARPSNVGCTCQYCQQLQAFLADPANEVGRIRAAEMTRHHVIVMINQQHCDVTHTVERQGSPHSLVLTKTTGSYQRAVQRYKTDCRLLKSLPRR